MILAVCLVAVIAYGLYAAVVSRYHAVRRATEDVYTALVYYLEDHDGTFPASEQDLVASDFVEHVAGGGYTIIARPESKWRPNTQGEVVPDLASFEIAWGVDSLSLSIDSDGIVRDDAGREVLLMRSPWPGARRYDVAVSRSFVELSRTLRESGLAP